MEQTPSSFRSDLAAFNGEVLDISDSTWSFLKRYPAYLFWIALIVLVLEVEILYFAFDPRFLLLPLLIPAFAYYKVYKKMQSLFFTQLAAILGMTYLSSATRSTVSGHFFSVGNSQGDPTHVLSGAYQGAPIRLFEYQFSTGSGKHRQTHHYVVSEIDAGGPLPHIFMAPENASVLGKPSGTKLLSLEGNFNDHFDVYVPEDSEIEALQILEPDVMLKLIEEFPHFGFECFGTKTYVFKSGSFADNRESLIQNIKFLERLYAELIPELKAFARS